MANTAIKLSEYSIQRKMDNQKTKPNIQVGLYICIDITNNTSL